MASWRDLNQPKKAGFLASPQAASEQISPIGEDKLLQSEAKSLLAKGDLEGVAALAEASFSKERIWPLYVSAVADWFRGRPMRSISRSVTGLRQPANHPADKRYKGLLREFQGAFTAAVPQLVKLGSQQKLSVCMIVKNEERALERCLRSVEKITDELVIVDTGSTDRTLEIAERFKANIGHFEWQDDFAVARNAALEMATGDWVLSIDADQWLDEKSLRPIRAAMADQTCTFLPLEHYVTGGTMFANRRLFPREGARWHQRLHEDVRYEGQDLMPVPLSAMVLHTDGRVPELVDQKAKVDRNRRLIELMERDGSPPELVTVYDALLTATDQPDAEETIEKLKVAAKLVTGIGGGVGRQLMMTLAPKLAARERFDEALQLANVAEANNLSGLWTIHLRARIAFIQGRRAEAHRLAELGLNTEDEEGPIDRLYSELQAIYDATKGAVP